MTIREAVNRFCDTIHIIGATKSHQLAKGLDPPCDRFRVMIRFERSVTTLDEYRHNLALATRRYPVDAACKDAGRFFWPCTEIVAWSDEGYRQEVELPPPPAQVAARAHYDRAQFQRLGKRPLWLERFLDDGKVCRVGRNQTVYAAAVCLRDLGLPLETVRDLIEKAPFDRRGFSDHERERTVTSGFNRGV